MTNEEAQEIIERPWSHEYRVVSYREYKPMRDQIEYTYFIACQTCSKDSRTMFFCYEPGDERETIGRWIRQHELGIEQLFPPT